MKDEHTGMVDFTLDSSSLPTMSREQMESLRNMRDEDIDYSDIPATPAQTEWTRPGSPDQQGMVWRVAALKEKVLLLDDDVAELAKEIGPERMNAVLRDYGTTLRKSA